MDTCVRIEVLDKRIHGSQTPIVRLANQALAAKKTDPEADTSAWEREIDRLVHELYELTEEEIRIVEGEAK